MVNDRWARPHGFIQDRLKTKPLSVQEKFYIINKVDSTPHVLGKNCRATRHPLVCSKYNNIKSKDDVGVVITHSETNPFKKFSCLISLIC
jgi:hypothetical protein